MLTLRSARVIRGLAFGVVALALVSSAYADNVAVKVKSGHLTMTGQVGGDVEVTITPTTTGIQIDGLGETTLNGGTDPFVTDDVDGDRRRRFARTSRVRFTANTPGAGIPRASVRKLNFFGGVNGGVVLSGLDVASNLKVDLGRARQFASLVVDDCTVAKSIKAKVGVKDEVNDVIVSNTTVTKALKISVRAQAGTVGRNTTYSVLDCTLGALSLGVKINSSNVMFERCAVNGNVSLRADIDLFLDDVDVTGNFSAKSNSHEQELMIDDLDVTGKAAIGLGNKDDTVTISNSTFGKLTVLLGKDDDALVTTNCTLGHNSKYDGSVGQDSWRTDGELDALKTVRVEDVDVLEP